MGRPVTHIRIGTEEDFEHRLKTLNLERINQGFLYDTKTGDVYCIADQDWKDYLTGKTDEVPSQQNIEIEEAFDISESVWQEIIKNKCGGQL